MTAAHSIPEDRILSTKAMRTSDPTQTLVLNDKPFFSYISNVLSTQTSFIIATECTTESFILIHVVQILIVSKAQNLPIKRFRDSWNLHSEEYHNLYSASNIIKMIDSRRMRK
jgi:hypothetical protein